MPDEGSYPAAFIDRTASGDLKFQISWSSTGGASGVAGPRRGKAWPRLFLGRPSMPSRYGVTPPFPGTLAGVLPYAAGALTSFNSAAAVIWIIWRWWWIDRRCLQAVQLLLVQLSGDVAA
jgi:hypothetical protein